MLRNPNTAWLAMLTVLALTGCSSNDDSPAAQTSEFNPDLVATDNAGEPGGDTTAIAGLWDGTVTTGAISDVVYWNIAANGVLTRHDYQQDGAASASGENCYQVSDPITVTPEGDDDYSFANVAATVVRTGDTLAITFSEADSADLDADGDTAEIIPPFNWSILTTPVLEDLNACR